MDMGIVSFLVAFSPGWGEGGGGRGLSFKKGRDAHQKFLIKHLKETNLGVDQAFFDP